ncbi:MAG TPA: type II toxin-antitoxin system HicA family toxin [Thermoanaerobaculia bacterium]|nr:type II toxin-antitoxin system HicA family toxin [Thermoanaerobaculia bacterium]
MSRLPSISGAEAIRAFERLGYKVDYQRGSHVVLRHLEPPHRRLGTLCSERDGAQLVRRARQPRAGAAEGLTLPTRPRRKSPASQTPVVRSDRSTHARRPRKGPHG